MVKRFILFYFIYNWNHIYIYIFYNQSKRTQTVQNSKCNNNSTSWRKPIKTRNSTRRSNPHNNISDYLGVRFFLSFFLLFAATEKTIFHTTTNPSNSHTFPISGLSYVSYLHLLLTIVLFHCLILLTFHRRSLVFGISGAR